MAIKRLEGGEISGKKNADERKEPTWSITKIFVVNLFILIVRSNTRPSQIGRVVDFVEAGREDTNVDLKQLI